MPPLAPPPTPAPPPRVCNAVGAVGQQLVQLRADVRQSVSQSSQSVSQLVSDKDARRVVALAVVVVGGINSFFSSPRLSVYFIDPVAVVRRTRAAHCSAFWCLFLLLLLLLTR